MDIILKMEWASEICCLVFEVLYCLKAMRIETPTVDANKRKGLVIVLIGLC